ncbi:hypothetical protein ES319_D03G034600v1 [Gossypium barbadense]|uniref:Major facilitator superfamily (MFS) profile domain-containing protein n=3 Tax=Gossypium TaxID=3633 RepID=A0A5J5S0D8_GOSBA|nr:hypothetical protein ES319_D03G034600v1 [Gossypium barbadense]TYG75522.1 hypothetical protein ES288_D03G037900v1 [Gossypium darwinii]
MASLSSTPSMEEEKEGSVSVQQSNPQSQHIAASSSTMDLPSNPSWFTPKRLLFIFCVVNMINYLDRGTIASNGVNGKKRTCDDKGICKSGSGIQGDFDLTNFQDGLLSSAFMVGLLVSSPVFASLAKSHNPFRLIGVGLSVFTLATAGCGAAPSFWFIAICRMLVGVGEASFISLAAPFIDNNAPISQKTAWLAVFYMCIPTGIAFGYVYGGLVGEHLNWRYAFWGEALLMFPFAVFGFVVKPLQLKGFSSVESKKALTPMETVSAVTDDLDASKVKGPILVGGDGISADELNKTSKLCSVHLCPWSIWVLGAKGWLQYLSYEECRYVVWRDYSCLWDLRNNSRWLHPRSHECYNKSCFYTNKEPEASASKGKEKVIED